VWVSLRRARGLLRLAVRDDGVGFDVGAAARATPGGLGLVGIRERMVALGGRFEIRSRPGQGAELLAAIPLRNQPWPAGFCSPMTTSSCAKA
jgi:two-component system NarL family sensor kinase